MLRLRHDRRVIKSIAVAGAVISWLGFGLAMSEFGSFSDGPGVGLFGADRTSAIPMYLWFGGAVVFVAAAVASRSWRWASQVALLGIGAAFIAWFVCSMILLPLSWRVGCAAERSPACYALAHGAWPVEREAYLARACEIATRNAPRDRSVWDHFWGWSSCEQLLRNGPESQRAAACAGLRAACPLQTKDACEALARNCRAGEPRSLACDVLEKRCSGEGDYCKEMRGPECAGSR